MLEGPRTLLQRLLALAHQPTIITALKGPACTCCNVQWHLCHAWPCQHRPLAGAAAGPPMSPSLPAARPSVIYNPPWHQQPLDTTPGSIDAKLHCSLLWLVNGPPVPAPVTPRECMFTITTSCKSFAEHS